MRVVVTGAGAVGRHLASDLADRGHTVTLIDQDPAVVQKVQEWAPNVAVVQGDACEPWVLEEADLKQAEVVVAATGDDEDNLVTSLLAKQEFAVPRVLARRQPPEERVALHRAMGCGRRRLPAAHPDGDGRGSGDGRRPRPARSAWRAGASPSWR